MSYLNKVKRAYGQPVSNTIDRQANIDIYTMRRKGVGYLLITQYPVHSYGVVMYMCNKYGVKYEVDGAEAKSMNLVDRNSLHQYKRGDVTNRFFTVEKLKNIAIQEYNTYNSDIKVLMLEQPSHNMPQLMLACIDKDVMTECNQLYIQCTTLCAKHLSHFKDDGNIQAIDEIVKQWNRLLESIL